MIYDFYLRQKKILMFNNHLYTLNGFKLLNFIGCTSYYFEKLIKEEEQNGI